ncbi:hypothetical protein [Pseudanabaena sp. PCC 6802]|uniref:hypothetical protein n=1 Tax=Pseudanabaena sp. PCC 6802 TaxID=118173 RepID=UPI00037888AC|nr:hypothetical protein [Pseudanabaena sp. PCC 6802]
MECEIDREQLDRFHIQYIHSLQLHDRAMATTDSRDRAVFKQASVLLVTFGNI